MESRVVEENMALNRPQFVIGDIGVYLEEILNNRFVMDQIERQLNGFQTTSEMIDTITQSIVFKRCDSIKDIKWDAVIPSNVFFRQADNLFYLDDFKYSYSLNKNQLSVYVEDKSIISIPFLVSQILLEGSKCFIHGAGISLNGKGKLIIAFGGIGKTSFLSTLIEKNGLKVLGDDLIIIDKYGNMFPYLRPFCIYEYHKKLFPAYFKVNSAKIHNPSLLNRVINKCYRLLKIKNNFNFNYVTVPVNAIFHKNQIETGFVKIEEIYLISRDANITEIGLNKQVTQSKAANFASNIIFHEFYEFARVIFNRQAFLDLSPSDMFQKHNEICDSAFQNVSRITEIKIPDHYDAERTAKELNKHIIGYQYE